jgi:hypothetical protein
VKRCSCRDETGTRLGSWCPHLRRPDVTWALGHGRWGYRLELPVPAGTPGRQLRRVGFPTREAAHLQVERLRIAHIQAMFTAITDHNTTIQAARR